MITYKNRLLMLAKHLEKGKLGHKIFDFSVFNAHENGWTCDPPTCGTRGCAIGECPILFPKEWEFNGVGLPQAKTMSNPKFFGLNHYEYEFLFLPFAFLPDSDRLPGTATKEQVAAHIRAFVKRKYK